MTFEYTAPPASVGGAFGASQFGDVAGGNYAEFESTGFLRFHGNARPWRDFNFGIGTLQRGSSAPDIINLSATSIQVLGFDGVATLEQVSVSLELDHMWQEESTVYAHIHWMPTSAAAGNVKWFFQFTVENTGGILGTAVTANVIQAAGGTAWMSRYAAFPQLNIPRNIGAQFHARLYRDPTDDDDTYGADAALSTVGLHIVMDTVGSRTVAAK